MRERGIAVLPPDINESQLYFTVVPEGVRFGLTAIKGLGEGAIHAILDVRERAGPITSLHQLCEELDLRIVNKKVLEALVKSGACDSLVPAGVTLATGRAKLFGAVDSAIEHGGRTQRDRDLGQSDLFGGGEDGGPVDHSAAGVRAVDRDGAAGAREGRARPLPERPSARSLRRRSAHIRRQDGRRSDAVGDPAERGWRPGD